MQDQTPILVAGGAGYIGSHTCKALAAAGYLPITLDSLVTGHAHAVRWGPLHRGDIGDAALVTRLVETYGIKGVVHFAAFSLVGESTRDPIKYYNNNVSAGLGFVRALVEAGVEAMVFSSTAAVYGIPHASPIPEEHAQNPINPYGASKLVFEQALHWIEEAHGFRSTILRYFNAAGADPEGEIGELHEPETHLIPLLCKAILGEAPPLTVYGADYDTPDGTAIRDYVHVQDLARAHVLALRRMLDGGSSLTLNLGAGEGATVLQIIQAAEQVLGRPVPYSLGARRDGDPVSLVADTSLARTELDWRPVRSDLASIISDAFAWHRCQRVAGAA